MRRFLAALLAGLALAGCGGTAGSRPIPTAKPSSGATSSPVLTSAPTTTPTSRPQPPSIQPGAHAYVAVTVATGWRNPSVVRGFDAPALANPVRIPEWLNAMNWSQKADLIDRADTQVLLGDRVLVVAVTGGWAQVAVPDQSTPLDGRGYPAWIPATQLSPIPPPTTATVAAVTTPTAWLHGPNGAATVEVTFGPRLPVIADRGSSLVVGLPDAATASIDTAQVTVSPSGTLPPTAASVLASAREFLGLQYLWAGTSGFGYDCSGLVYLVYRMHGVLLPRDADAQATAGRWVSRAALQSGDLVFFGTSASTIHHVAIYAGDGTILESPQTGSPVRVVPLSTYDDYFSGRHVLP